MEGGSAEAVHTVGPLWPLGPGFPATPFEKKKRKISVVKIEGELNSYTKQIQLLQLLPFFLPRWDGSVYGGKQALDTFP